MSLAGREAGFFARIGANPRVFLAMALDPITSPPKLVTSSEKVTSIYGGWPRFHDAEIISLLLDRREPALLARILALHVDRSQIIDAARHFKVLGRYTVALHFRDIEDLSIVDFNHQNVLGGIYFDDERDRMKVTMDGIFGAHVIFTCSNATVQEVSRSDAAEDR